VVAELPGGSTLIYDCGSLGASASTADAVARYLWSRRIASVDAIVLSHADADHFSLLPPLLERFHVRRVCMPPHMFDEDRPTMRALARLLDAAGAEAHVLRANQQLVMPGPCGLRVLHPSETRHGGGDNENSLVLAVCYQGRAVLLPGDIDGEGMERLLAQPTIPSDVLMAPHHGSATSDPGRLTAWCSASCVIISGAHSRDLPLLKARLIDPSVRVWHTAVHGAVQVTLERSALKVVPYRTPAAGLTITPSKN
jgi:competence protein ComEC